MLGNLAVANFLPHRVEIGRFLGPHVDIHGLPNRRIIGFEQRVAHRRLERKMNLETGKLIRLNIFDALHKGARQMLIADHFNESRIRIGIRNHGKPGSPFPSVAQAHSGSAAVFHQNLFHMVNRANLAAVMHIGPLQHLCDGMRPAARQLRLFLAGNHF